MRQDAKIWLPLAIFFFGGGLRRCCGDRVSKQPFCSCYAQTSHTRNTITVLFSITAMSSSSSSSFSPKDASPSYSEFVSAYDQATHDHDWLAELSEEWISNSSSAEPSEQGSARGMSIRSAFPSSVGKIDTIPEEAEEYSSTVRIVLGETDVSNTPEWKRRLDEARKTTNLFSPCHLESLFKESTNKYHTLLLGVGS
jgi:hypothetical protein